MILYYLITLCIYINIITLITVLWWLLFIVNIKLIHYKILPLLINQYVFIDALTWCLIDMLMMVIMIKMIDTFFNDG